MKSIRILDTHSKVDLIVADLEKREPWGEDPDKRLTLAEGSSIGRQRKDRFTLKDAQDGDLQPVAIGITLGQATRVGGSLMLYPEKKYRLEITLHKEGEAPEEGFDITTEEWLTVGPPYGASDSETNLFRQGISYMVTITVNDIEEVKANASLTELAGFRQRPLRRVMTCPPFWHKSPTAHLPAACLATVCAGRCFE